MAVVVILPDPDIMMQDGPWDVGTFCIAPFANSGQAPIPPTVNGFGTSDTFRGGSTLILSASSTILDTSADATFRIALPAAWTPSITASGVVLTDPSGTVLDTGGDAGSSAALNNSASLTNFDVAVDISLIGPRVSQTSTLEVARLRFTTVGGDVFQIRALADASGFVRFIGEAIVNGVTFVGDGKLRDPTQAFRLNRADGLTVPTPNTFTLRLVRHGALVWAFLGRRDQPERYVELEVLLAFGQFALGTGVIDVSVDNGANAARVHTRVTNYTIRPHARVGTRLLLDKETRRQRVTGTVPAASLQEVGTVDFALFGPDLDITTTNGFTYTLPAPRTVGRDRDRRLEFYSDRNIRDVETV